MGTLLRLRLQHGINLVARHLQRDGLRLLRWSMEVSPGRLGLRCQWMTTPSRFKVQP